MAIGNCLFSLLLKILADFQFSAYSRDYTGPKQLKVLKIKRIPPLSKGVYQRPGNEIEQIPAIVYPEPFDCAQYRLRPRVGITIKKKYEKHNENSSPSGGGREGDLPRKRKRLLR